MLSSVTYWLQGEPVQNFGDFLSAFFLKELFYDIGRQDAAIRIIGSCLDDGLLEAARSSNGTGLERTIFWGCGLRHEHSLSERARKSTDILSVRGPLSRSALRLGEAVPMGDPALVLPAIYQPRPTGCCSGATVLVPHFHEERDDGQLRKETGCDAILRPNLRNDLGAITDFIDQIAAADFVLCGSLHAAVVAAAYGRRFAFWDSGAIDLPFKWMDFAGSIGIPCVFQPSLGSAEQHYVEEIRPALSIPVLWPLLSVAPLPVRADALEKVIATDLLRHGPAALEAPASSTGSQRLQAEIARGIERVRASQERLAEANTRLQTAFDQAAEQVAAGSRAAEQRLGALRSALSEANDEIARTREEAAARAEAARQELKAAVSRATAAEAATATAARRCDQIRLQLDATQVRLNWTEAALNSVWTSTSWQLLGPFRWLGRRSPRVARRVRQTIKLVWWTLTLQLGYRFMLWRRHQSLLRHAAVALQSPAERESLPAPPEGTTTAPAPDAAGSSAPADDGQQEIQTAPAPDDTGLSEPTVDLQTAFQNLYGTAAVYFPPVPEPDVSIIIPAYRGLDDLMTCLRSIAVSRPTEPSFEVIVVDDSPDAPVLWALPRSGGLIGVPNEANLGFLLSCNRGATKARGRVLCFLNSDTIVLPGWLSHLVQVLAETPSAALAGGMLLNRDGTIQDAGWQITQDGWGHSMGRGACARDGAYTYRREVDCVTGACFCIPKTVWDALGGFDCTFLPAYYEEFDLAFRAKQKGMAVVYEPRSQVIHLGSSSYQKERRDALSDQHHAIFARRYADMLSQQPETVTDEFATSHAGTERRTILVVDANVPEPERHAGDVTMSSYLTLLAEAGWRIVFGPSSGEAEGPPCEKLESLGIEMIRKPQTIAGWLKEHGRLVHQVWLSRPDIAAKLLPTVRACTAAPIAYYTHDLHHLRMMREAELKNDPGIARAAEEMRALEIKVLSSVDHIMTPSEEEGVIIRELVPTVNTTAVPPYFFGDDQISALNVGDFDGRSDVIFVGGFPHVPNVDAACFIVNEVMPEVWRVLPQVRLLLVGYAPPPEVQALAGERVVVTGQVPELEPWFDRSRLMLAALRYGAGVKGKVVEALRRGVPVVATPVGAEGIGIENGRDAVVADDATTLAGAVIELLGDAERCAELSSAGAALIRRRFSRAAARSSVDGIFCPPHPPHCSGIASGDVVENLKL